MVLGYGCGFRGGLVGSLPLSRAMSGCSAEEVGGGDYPDRARGEWRGFEGRVAVAIERKEQRARSTGRSVDVDLREALSFEVVFKKVDRCRSRDDIENCRPSAEGSDGAVGRVLGGAEGYERPRTDRDSFGRDSDLLAHEGGDLSERKT
ncbi:hypothetical protein ACW2Q0_21070 [Nocardia sp. R16R-3T]